MGKLPLKSILYLFLIFVNYGNLTGNTAIKEDYDIYLLIGQSNMAGRGYMLEADTLNFIDGVWLLNSDGVPEKAKSPFNKYSSIRKELKMQNIGPGESFSKEIHRRTKKKILLVVNARGGSSIKSWLPSAKDGYFDEAVRRTKQALDYGTLKAVLWHQGESNSGNPSNYLNDLKLMVEELRKRLNVPNVPFVAGEIAPWHPNRNKFNTVIHNIKDSIYNSDWVSSEGCAPRTDFKDPHFSRDGQMLLGFRYAEKNI